jgi:hypothetical protein
MARFGLAPRTQIGDGTIERDDPLVGEGEQAKGILARLSDDLPGRSIR